MRFAHLTSYTFLQIQADLPMLVTHTFKQNDLTETVPYLLQLHSLA